MAKIEASQQLLPIEKSQFEIQIERHEQIMNSLTLTGLAHNVGLLGSTNKEKSGVMRILKYTHSYSYKNNINIKNNNNNNNNNNKHKHNKWEDHFFVLAHCTLYYFQHDPDSQITHSSMPKSFIPLKYATIDLDVERIKSDRFVFYICTPLRTVYLRCRHPVALSEWVSSLYKAQGNNNNNTSKIILNKIREIRSKVSTLNKLLKEKKGIKLFHSYLKSIKSQSILRCWLAILHWKQQQQQQQQSDDDEKYNDNNEAKIIFEQYINDDEAEENNNCIWNYLDCTDYDKELIMDCKKYIYLKKNKKKIIEIFDCILEILDDKLNYEFINNFKKCNEYLNLQKKYDSKDKYLPLPLNRKILNFEEGSIIILIITNSDLSTKEIKLSTKKEIATIGRDCSNIIVLDDAHVSRSHARIKYNKYNAYFTDLGSHHGSYLNGNRVLYEQLKNGDRLKIGGCDIQFIIKIKKNIMKNVFNKMFNNNNNNDNNNNNNKEQEDDKRRDTHVSNVAFM